MAAVHYGRSEYSGLPLKRKIKSLERDFRKASQLAAMQPVESVHPQQLHRLDADLQVLVDLCAIELISHAYFYHSVFRSLKED
jgi:hypothetical protein